jgi:VWFA-related protein
MIGQGRAVSKDSLKKIMERLAVPTGGRALFTDSIDELRGTFGELIEELSSQYLLGYAPENTRRDDTWHRIRVQVDGHSDVRARQGFRVESGR